MEVEEESCILMTRKKILHGTRTVVWRMGYNEFNRISSCVLDISTKGYSN